MQVKVNMPIKSLPQSTPVGEGFPKTKEKIILG